MNVSAIRYRADLLTCLVAVAGAGIPTQTASGQTLNEAVTTQLAAELQQDGSFLPCAQLLSGGGTPSGNLAVICGRSVPGVPTASVGGGFAGTPVAPPTVVEERLEAEEEESSSAQRGFFFTAAYDAVDREVSPFEDGYDSNRVSLAAGVDFAVGTSWVLGFAIDGSQQDGDFVDGGDFEIREIGLTGFGALLFGETGSLDFYYGYSDQSVERQRRATFVETVDLDEFRREGMPVADFDASRLTGGISMSYDWAWDNVTFGPRLGYGYQKTDYDSYDEVDNSGLALTFHDDDETSSQFYGGFAGSVAISTAFGALLVEQSILYRYETDQDQRDIEISFVEDTSSRRFTYQSEVPDRDFLQISAGATFVLRDGLQLGLGYRGIASHRYLSSNGFEFLFRKEF